MRALLPDQRACRHRRRMPEARRRPRCAWLEPYPDFELEGIADETANPEARYNSREAMQLAFVAAIQQLPPRQRAALLLRDVLGWSAAEAATTAWAASIASVNSALQRARETLAKRYPDGRPEAPSQPNSGAAGAARAVIAGLGRARSRTVSSLSSKRRRPTPCRRGGNGMQGGRRSARFVALAWSSVGELRLSPTAANGQPAFAVYARTGVEPAGPPTPFRSWTSTTRPCPH